jgi:cell division protein ZapA
MPDVSVTIGGREFTVACQPGEEAFLHSAAGMLDTEAATLIGQIGRLPEARMLLMAGLMLADRTIALEERVQEAEAQLREFSDRPPPAPERVEVVVIPPIMVDTLAEIAARAEALAQSIEDRTAPL